MTIDNKSVAWLISNLRTNDFEELFNTELASTRMRAGVCISGCRKSNITVLPPNYRKLEHSPSMVFMAKFVPDSNTGQFLDDGGVRRDLWLKKIDLLEKQGCQLILDYKSEVIKCADIAFCMSMVIRSARLLTLNT